MAAVSLSSGEGELEPKDPFLRAHRIAHLTYDLSGRFRPPAIRDQMVRARLLIDRARDEGLFRRNSILIVGAGIAGVSVAFQARKRGVHSVIAEQNNDPFGRFLLCSTRRVDPTEYDWPLDHWQSGRLQGLPLEYSAGSPSELAIAWQGQLTTLVMDGWTETIYGRRLERDGLAVHDDRIEAQLSDGGPPRAFDFAIYCEGPGMEDCRVGAYAGLEFFQEDPFEEPALGLPEGVTPRVLISGSGDGALQDFIRIASGVRSVGQLYHDLFHAGDPDLERQISAAESQARRMLLWSAHSRGAAHDHHVHIQLKLFYDSLLRKLNYPDWRNLREKFRAIAGARLRDKRVLHVAHPCTHLSHCYPLNRFMARLIMSFLRSEDEHRFRFIPNSGTLDVAGLGHTCRAAKECHGNDHLITFSCFNCT